MTTKSGNGLSDLQKKQLAIALAKRERLLLDTAFDAFDLNSEPTEDQRKVFEDINSVGYRWVVGGNRSGKTQLGARELTWIILDKHPYFKRPASWNNQPLTCLVVGKVRQLIENELWLKKIRPFLDPTEWKETRVGNILQSVQHKETKDTIVFLTHGDSSNRVVQNLQGYTAHYVWVDEMPGSTSVISELQRRLDTTKGPFLATFTPTVTNLDIRRLVDSAVAPVAKKYRLAMVDNPLVDKDEAIAKMAGYSEAEKRTRLYGEWAVGEESVYFFDYDTMVEPLPETYHPNWRHVESVDPGIRNAGYSLWAEDPATGVWYCVKAEHLKDSVSTEHLVNEVLSLSKGYNIVRRVCDPANPYYYQDAARLGVKPAYIVPYAKNQNRKEALISNLQNELTRGKIKITPSCATLIDELQRAKFNDVGNKIVNSSSYHCTDTAQYFVDTKPKRDVVASAQTWDAQLLEQHKQREAAKAKKPATGYKWYKGTASRRFRR